MYVFVVIRRRGAVIAQQYSVFMLPIEHIAQ